MARGDRSTFKTLAHVRRVFFCDERVPTSISFLTFGCTGSVAAASRSRGRVETARRAMSDAETLFLPSAVHEGLTLKLGIRD